MTELLQSLEQGGFPQHRLDMDERDWEGTPRSLHGFCSGSSHSIPTESLSRKRLQFGVTHCSLCHPAHDTHKTWQQQPDHKNYSQEEHGINRKQANDTGSGYLTTGKNRKTQHKTKKCISTCTETVKINNLLAIGDGDKKMNLRPFLEFHWWKYMN